MGIQIEEVGNVPQWSLEDRLRKAREWADMNQTELAESLNVSRVHVGRLETGKVAIKRPMLMAWALATGVSFFWLETGHEKSPSPSGERLSEVVRPKGFEPPTFCSVAKPHLSLVAA